MSVKVQRMANPEYLLTHDAEELLQRVSLAAELEPRWHGKGAAEFELVGHAVTPEAFRNLFRGFAPDGRSKLVQNAGKKDRAIGWESIVSPDKSVSDLLCLFPREEWHEVIRCHRAAVAVVIEEIERFCGISRRGKAGSRTEPAGLIVSEHTHLDARNHHDPLIHSHVCVVNAGFRQSDGTFGALRSEEMYVFQRLLDAVYQQQISKLLRERLKIVTRREKYAARVLGIPDALIQATSTRSEELKQAMAEHGGKSAKSARIAALSTRNEKEQLTSDELARLWSHTASSLGVTLSDVLRAPLRQLTPEQEVRTIERAIREAARSLNDEASHFERKELLARTFIELIGKPLDRKRVFQVFDKALANGHKHGLIHLEGRGLSEVLTTRRHLRLEERLLKELETLAGRDRQVVSERRIKGVLDKHPELSSEQREAVKMLSDGKRLTALTGLAGTGKTTALRAVKEVLLAPWFGRKSIKPNRIIGCAVSGRAADTLERGTGIESSTLASLLFRLRPTPLLDVFLEVRKKSFFRIRDLLKYACEVRRPRLTLDKRTTVVLDEASLANTKDLLELTRRVRKARAKLILVGDPKQLQAIGPAGGLRLVLNRFPERVAELTSIQRQERPAERQAVQFASEGRSKEVLAAYRSEGRLTVASDPEGARMEAVSLFKTQGGMNDPRNHLLIANTNAEVRWLNQIVQDQRRREGLLGEESLRVAGALPDGSVTLHAGDRVQFLKNQTLIVRVREPLMKQLLRGAASHIQRKLAEKLPDWVRVFIQPQGAIRVRNGEYGTVIALLPRLNRMLVQLDSGEQVVLNTRKYPHLTLGYATTTYKSQSTTVENVYALVGGPLTDRESAYVELSRGRKLTHLVVTRHERSPEFATAAPPGPAQAVDELVRQMATSHQEQTALEFLFGKASSPTNSETVQQGGATPEERPEIRRHR